MTPDYTPRPEHKFSFGLWTVSNRGRDPFGDVVRPALWQGGLSLIRGLPFTSGGA